MVEKLKFKSFLYKTIVKIWKIIPYKFQLASILKKNNYLISKLYLDFKYKGIFKVQVQNKAFLFSSTGTSTIENEIFWKGIENGWEKISLGIWSKLVAINDVIFDIGANTGIYSLVASTINNNAVVYAFEPSENTYKVLKNNLNLNGYNNVFPLNVAISNTEGQAIFHDFTFDNQLSASLNIELGAGINEEFKRDYLVQTTTIDAFIKKKNITNIGLLKIDVEMHEPEVLQGMMDTLVLYKPTLLIEVLIDEIAQKIELILKDLGYLFYSIDEIIPPVLVSKINQSPCYNYLICQPDISKFLGLEIPISD